MNSPKRVERSVVVSRPCAMGGPYHAAVSRDPRAQRSVGSSSGSWEGGWLLESALRETSNGAIILLTPRTRWECWGCRQGALGVRGDAESTPGAGSGGTATIHSTAAARCCLPS